MLFSEIIGQNHIKNHLTRSADRGRVPHAQLFVGEAGNGMLPMAIAYAQYILCGNQNDENNVENACNTLCGKLEHPDLHFAFPVATNDKIKKHPVSNHFMEEWREFVQSNPYGSLYDWYQSLGIEKKQGKIGVDEAADIVKTLSLKSYQGGFKVMIVWQAEKMNREASNKLLKLIEEPPEKTIFLLIAEEEGKLLQTIRSRCQVLHFPPLGETVLVDALTKITDPATAGIVARQANGSYTKALEILRDSSGDDQFETWFIKWVRTAFGAKGNKKAIQGLIAWSEEIAKTNRETQKRFLLYCLDFFRQAMLLNYKGEELVYFTPKTKGFAIEKFAPFIHGNNILTINKEVQDAIFHIERNGNGKLILLDLSIKLTRLLHVKGIVATENKDKELGKQKSQIMEK